MAGRWVPLKRGPALLAGPMGWRWVIECDLQPQTREAGDGRGSADPGLPLVLAAPMGSGQGLSLPAPTP